MLSGGCGGDRLSVSWSDTKAAEHRCQRQAETTEFRLRFRQGCSASREVNIPERRIPAGILRAAKQFRYERRIDYVSGQHLRSPTIGPIRCNAVKMQNERIARFSTLDEEWASHRVAAWRNLCSCSI